MRKTKIICTIGPATCSIEMLEKLYKAGMNVVRLNMSHGDHDWHARVIRAVQKLNRRVKYTVPIMLDTQGPEIRTGLTSTDLNLREGEEITIVVRGTENVEESSIQIDYADIIQAVDVGDRITVDNGLINLEVLSKQERIMRCRVIDGGSLGSKRHVNLPGIRVNLPAITDKDRHDIAFGVAHDVDYIALSFAREAADVRALREFLGDKARKVKIIAKIEDQEGVRNLEEIVQEADGIMVARGDLGVEVNFYELPNIQRRIVRICAEQGKRVIVAGFDARAVRPLRGAGFALGASTSDVVRCLPGALLGRRVVAPFEALCIPPYHNGIPVPIRSLVRSFRGSRTVTHIWTINDPDHARRLWAKGVNGIISDDPGAILAARAKG